MKITRTIVCAGCTLLLSAAASHAASLTGVMLIDPGVKSGGTYTGGSYFAMGADNPNGTAAMLKPQPTGPGGIELGTYQNFVLDPNVPHPYNWDGLGASAGTGYLSPPVTQSNMLLPFSFFGNATYVGTNPVAYQSGNAHSAPTADVDLNNCVGSSCALSVDLSSWEVMWNGSAFEQGPRPVSSGPFVLATGTYDMVTHAYSISWESQINGGPFNNVTGYWHLEGAVVPVPAALWLFGSGLLGLAGITRRKKKNQ